MISEIWRDIEGYEGLYQASNLGRVKSLIKVKEHVLQPALTSSGKHTVCLYGDGNMLTLYVEKLVAETFILNLEDLPYIEHLNGDVEDNRVCNLKWSSLRFRTNKKRMN